MTRNSHGMHRQLGMMGYLLLPAGIVFLLLGVSSCKRDEPGRDLEAATREKEVAGHETAAPGQDVTPSFQPDSLLADSQSLKREFLSGEEADTDDNDTAADAAPLDWSFGVSGTLDTDAGDSVDWYEVNVFISGTLGVLFYGDVEVCLFRDRDELDCAAGRWRANKWSNMFDAPVSEPGEASYFVRVTPGSSPACAYDLRGDVMTNVPPQITSVINHKGGSSTGRPGDVIEIHGNHFAIDPDHNNVVVCEASAELISSTEDTIVATIPDDALDGEGEVRMTVTGSRKWARSPLPFTIVGGATAKAVSWVEEDPTPRVHIPREIGGGGIVGEMNDNIHWKDIRETEWYAERRKRYLECNQLPLDDLVECKHQLEDLSKERNQEALREVCRAAGAEVALFSGSSVDYCFEFAGGEMLMDWTGCKCPDGYCFDPEARRCITD